MDWTQRSGARCPHTPTTRAASALDATQPALASQLFIFAADPDFTAERILPLFIDDVTAARAWHPYLYHPRYNDRLLSAGLLQGAIAEWGRLEELGHDLQRQFFGVVASIVSFAGISRGARQDLLDQSLLAQDGAYAAQFAESSVALLRADGVDGAEVWNHWLRDHLVGRQVYPETPSLRNSPRWADCVPSRRRCHP